MNMLPRVHTYIHIYKRETFLLRITASYYYFFLECIGGTSFPQIKDQIYVKRNEQLISVCTTQKRTAELC